VRVEVVGRGEECDCEFNFIVKLKREREREGNIIRSRHCLPAKYPRMEEEHHNLQ
jgi:hypothetical protein